MIQSPPVPFPVFVPDTDLVPSAKSSMVLVAGRTPPVRRPLTWCSRWRFYWCHMSYVDSQTAKLNNDPKNTINSGLGTQEWNISTHTKCVNDTNCQQIMIFFCLIFLHGPLPTIPLLRRAMRHFGRLLRRFGPCQSLKGKCSWSAKRTSVFLAKKGLWRCWICLETSC